MEKYFTVSSLTDLFKSSDNYTVINFIKDNQFLSPTAMFVTLVLYYLYSLGFTFNCLSFVSDYLILS